MIKAVIFDMDGVLIEAKEWHYLALNKALSFFGIEISLNDHKNFYDGLPTKIKLEALSDELKLPSELHKLINRLKQKYTMELIYEKCKPTFHHEFLLDQLKKEGFLIGLASNSKRDTVNLMLSKANISNRFDIILSNEDVKNPKPDKEIYEKIIQYFNILPSEAFVIEDHDIGIQSAKKAGAYVLKVNNTEDVKFKKIFNEINRINML